MSLPDHWLSVVHRGLLAIAFGLLALLGPEQSLTWFAPLMLIYAMADGLLAISTAARAAFTHTRWACYAVEGLAGLSGIVVIAIWPEVNFLELTWSLAGWATITAISAVLTCGAPGKEVTRAWLLATAGVCLIRFTVLAIGAIRAREFPIALGCGANAMIFATLFLVRILRLGGGGDVRRRRGPLAVAHSQSN